jgi:hypothetical protein
MSRIIIFGCSFTQYGWPTWANILGYDSDTEYHNFAIAGLGNVGIMHRVLEADIKLKFTKDDKILILWSSWSREDRVRDCNWIATGSVFNFGNPEYNNYFIKRYWNIDNDTVKNASAIIAVNKMYGDIIEWQGTAFKLGSSEAANTKRKSSSRKLFDLYAAQLPELPYYNFERSDRPLPFGVVKDGHPDIIQHMKILQEFIYPALGKQLKQTTIDIFTALHTDVCNKVSVTSRVDTIAAIEIVEKIYKHSYPDIYKNCNDHYRITDD